MQGFISVMLRMKQVLLMLISEWIYSVSYTVLYLKGKKVYCLFILAVPPSFTVSLQDMVIFEGDQLLLQCQATGAPPPHYTWYRGNIMLGQSNQYDTSVPGMLRMADVSRDQGGTYNCSAISFDNGKLVGRNSSSAMVFVIRKYSLCQFVPQYGVK